ncbi:hypothetical protein [Actinomadura kijaniata]|uniref:hypothetical protein n=1 Tax=Actinomadura kijaniata TaxID=46161 RepID=UPI00082B51E0|nr:hypothetical protein [Actinomadura kijaniata]
MAAVASAVPDDPGRGGPADATLVSVRLPHQIPLPGRAGHLFREGKLPLVASRQQDRMGVPVRFRFTALSTDTVSNVRCSVPGPWMVVKTDSPGRAVVERPGPRPGGVGAAAGGADRRDDRHG